MTCVFNKILEEMCYEKISTNKYNEYIHVYICTSVFTIPAQTTKAFALQQDEKERRMSVVKDTALYYYSPVLPENCVY